MPCMKKNCRYIQERRRSTRQQPGTKSGRRPADKLFISRWLNGYHVPPSVYIGFVLFVLPAKRSGQLSTMLRKAKGTVLLWANRPVGILSYPAPPSGSAVRRPAPICPLYIRILGSTNQIC